RGRCWTSGSPTFSWRHSIFKRKFQLLVRSPSTLYSTTTSEGTMRPHCAWPWVVAIAALLSLEAAGNVYGACCYFSAKDKDIEQPSQKVFTTWDPAKKSESFTVQPRFEGNALDFGMVIPTPTQPKLHEMPRDFFKSLAVYTILKQREFPSSQLLPLMGGGFGGFYGMGMYGTYGGGFGGMGGMGFPGAPLP